MAVSLVSTGVTFPDNSTQTTAATGFGFKNRIINGAMVINQRGGVVSSSGFFGLDRYAMYVLGGPSYSIQQSTTAPDGFSNSLLATVVTPSASNTYSFLYQGIEGFNIADFAWGTASATPITLSFWVRSSVTGIFSGSLANSAGNRCYAFQFTINSANTYEYKTITIAGDTSGTWNKDNTVGIAFRISLGSARTITPNVWGSSTGDGATGSTGGSTWINTSGATFYLTGLQLEKGSTATSFDYRPYGTELALCQRYFQSYTDALLISRGTGYNTTAGITQSFSFPVQMRIAPAATVLNGSNAGAPSALTIPNIGVGACTFAVNPTSSATTMYYQWNMTLSSEL